jgi:hypothetical protein
MLPLTNRDVIRDSAVQLGLSHQRGAIGVLIHQHSARTCSSDERVRTCNGETQCIRMCVRACMRA